MLDTPSPDLTAIENELIRLERLRDALRFVRSSDDCTAAPMKPRGQNAMLVLTSEVLDQISRVRRAFDGGPKPEADEHYGEKPLWAKNSSVTGQLMELIGKVTDEDLDKACAEDREYIGELCREMASRTERDGERRACR
jgi:hypothetical protein